MTYRFAAVTEVPPERSRAEIEALLRKAGCERFGLMQAPGRATLAVELGDRRFRFEVRVPAIHDPEVALLPDGTPRQQRHLRAARDQIERTRWRTLLLAIKAQLAMVEAGLADFQHAFLAHLLLPSGRTVAEETCEPIRLAYQGGDVPLLEGH